MWLLAGENFYYVKKSEELSIFLPGSRFLSLCLESPGGFVGWMACYFTQYFFHSWLGAAIYVILAVGLMLATVWAFRLPSCAWGLSAAMPAAAVASFLSLGYLLFSVKALGIAYAMLLGSLWAVLLFWAYTCAKPWWLRTAAMLAIAIAGYPLFGFYALAATGACIAYEVSARRPAFYVAATAGALAAFLFPIAYHRFFATVVTEASIYTAGLPFFFVEEKGLLTPYYAFAAIAIVLAAAAPHFKAEPRKWLAATAIAVFAASLLWMWQSQCTDANFRLSLRLERAINDGDWEKAYAAGASFGEEPTRLNTLLSYIPLLRNGKAADLMFGLPSGSAPYESLRKTLALRDIGAQPISFHFGRVNNAYRWAMEYVVEYGLRVDYLKTMVKCALLNGDYRLAKKYLRTLSQTKYHKAWVERYMAMAEDPDKILDDQELNSVSRLMAYRDHIGGDGGKVESFIIPDIAAMGGGSPELADLSMQCNLIQKNVDGFMQRFLRALPQMERVPKHYQEAALAWAMVHQNDAYKRLPLDKEVVDRFERFMRMSKASQHLTEEQAARSLKEAFGDTYWYYFLYTNTKRNQHSPAQRPYHN